MIRLAQMLGIGLRIIATLGFNSILQLVLFCCYAVTILLGVAAYSLYRQYRNILYGRSAA